jgi:redox-sensitive bicupin YhaK (pirin superfamily)
MIERRAHDGLGAFRNAWLDTKYHFSFSSYHDPARMGVGALRVWNDDAIAPGTGFDPHPHRDMEIITYVRSGAISHRDNLGNAGRTAAGDVQVMHAGTGIVHAEYNEDSVPVTLFQIWIQPNRTGVQPGWATRQFPRSGTPSILASGNAAEIAAGALPLYADATLVAGTLAAGASYTRALPPGRALYMVPSRGTITVNGTPVGPRDGAVARAETEVTIAAADEAEIVLVDVIE